LQIRDATPEDLTIVAGWIGSARDCERWAGPRVPYPLDISRLPEQIAMAEAINLAIVDDRGLAGFGQVVPRGAGRGHLTRVIVRLDARGRGLGGALCEALLSRAASAGLTLATLYVYRDNPQARRLYEALGFRPDAGPPEEWPSPLAVFMRRPTDLGTGGGS
jgi:[ribosomal protein S18]-alanine N-acetyltransferase